MLKIKDNSKFPEIIKKYNLEWDADDDYEMGVHYAIYMKAGVVFDVSHTAYDDITDGVIYIEGIDGTQLDILYDLIKADLVEKVDE